MTRTTMTPTTATMPRKIDAHDMRRGWLPTLAMLALSGAMVSGCSPRETAPTGPGTLIVAQKPEGRPNLTSNLQIKPGETFVFAGEPDAGAYTASVENVGPVAVTLGTRTGVVDASLVTLKPGESIVARFAKAQGALFLNSSGEQARLLLKIWGDTNVGMRYEPLRGLRTAEPTR